MKKRPVSGYIFPYLRSRVILLITITASAGMAVLVLYLYRVPAESIFYALLLAACVMVAAAAVDLISFCRRHSALSNASGSTGDITGMLPEPSGQIQKDYDRLVRELYDKHNETLAASAAARSEMSDYYAMWVHQIKTPIQAMRLLMDENEKNSQKGIELFRIEQYVEMALSYVRLGSEQTDYVLKEYDIDTVVRRAVRKYAPVFIAKKIAVDCRDTGIRAVTDEKWMQFVIEQLLSNSLKYTKKGTVTIYSDKDNVLTIEDTGIGIAREDISRVTQKGFTGYNGRTGNKSTGLGLYLSGEILKRLSHTMTIDSEEGIGTRVSLDLSRQEQIYE